MLPTECYCAMVWLDFVRHIRSYFFIGLCPIGAIYDDGLVPSLSNSFCFSLAIHVLFLYVLNSDKMGLG